MINILVKDLKKLIKSIYNATSTDIDKRKKQIIIGGKKRADKCSFKEIDKEFYNSLLKYTLVVDGISFVDKDGKNCEKFNRTTAVDNAISYLKTIGIKIEATFHCESERKLLAKFVCHVLEDIMGVMFSSSEEFNEKKYNKDMKAVKEKYRRKIISKGIISLIYSNANWSDVELYKSDEEADNCLLIDNDSDWRAFYGITYLDTGMRLWLASDTDVFSKRGIKTNDAHLINLKDKQVHMREETHCFLDFFNLDNDYYVPNKFVYCTESGSANLEQAQQYLLKTFCYDKKHQYMNTINAITYIIDRLLHQNYNDFYSDEYNISKTSFETGLEQLTYYFEDHRIDYSKKDIQIIYKYLISKWIGMFSQSLELFSFDSMYSLYPQDMKEDDDYKKCIETNRLKIKNYKSLDILDSADEPYKRFCERNKEVIDNFKNRIEMEEYGLEKCHGSVQSENNYINTEYNSFKELKESIKDFQKRFEWTVPYFVYETIVEGDRVPYQYKRCLGYGRVGDTKPIYIEQDERYTVEGPTSIKLRFDRNIAYIKYILKPEYVQDIPKQEQVKTTNNQDPGTKEVADLVFKNGYKYCIDIEASGTSTAPFSVFIIRRTVNNGFEIVFEKNDIKLSADFTVYSYEFTYNGENGDLCYFSFGYGNIIGGYTIRQLHVSEIE